MILIIQELSSRHDFLHFFSHRPTRYIPSQFENFHEKIFNRYLQIVQMITGIPRTSKYYVILYIYRSYTVNWATFLTPPSKQGIRMEEFTILFLAQKPITLPVATNSTSHNSLSAQTVLDRC